MTHYKILTKSYGVMMSVNAANRGEAKQVFRAQNPGVAICEIITGY